MTPPLWQKEKRNRRASWWKWKRRVKIWLKTQHSENEDHGIWSHHFMANRWGNRGNSERLYFLGFQLTADGDCSHEIKRRLLLGRKVMTILCSVAQLCLTLSRLVIIFLSRSKCLLISWLQSLSAVILEPRKIKSVTVSTVSPSFALKWWDWMPLS